jgi:hypothetical protein
MALEETIEEHKTANQKELHVWLSSNHNDLEAGMLNSLDEALNALIHNEEKVNTTQTHCFSTEWIEKGYHLFAHFLDDTVIEIKLGKNTCTNKEICVAHNIEKMLLANAFGPAVREY